MRDVRGRTFHDQTDRSGQHPTQTALGLDHAGDRGNAELYQRPRVLTHEEWANFRRYEVPVIVGLL